MEYNVVAHAYHVSMKVALTDQLNAVRFFRRKKLKI